jgi:hypothetical protein
MDMDTNIMSKHQRVVGLINFNFKSNDYAIKCEIYNKLTKMGVVTYKNVWNSDDLEIYSLNLPICTFELQNKILIMYSNHQIAYDSKDYKYLREILQMLEQ